MTGGVTFLLLGALMIALALTGNASSAPGVQKAFGRWLTALANDIATTVPSAVGWALVLALAATVIYFSARALRRPPPRQAPGGDAPEPRGVVH